MLSNIKSFIRFNWIVLVLIYLVVIAGSFVRITGSGMGCPDWPKCFGQWIPPTDESQLPENYREEFRDNRIHKIEKFSKMLTSFGFVESAAKIMDDETLLDEQPFNAKRTWTEYVNRLFGFLAGNGMLLAFIWMLVYFRKRKWILLALSNLVLMGFQAWFGSIVVASNLVPWTITVHMFLALLIIALQLLLIKWLKQNPDHQANLDFKLPNYIKVLLYSSGIIITYQMFLGTQVREMIDELTKMGFGREDWTTQLGLPFYIHRSFSWLVLILIGILAWKNEKIGLKNKVIRAIFILLGLELISGVLLAYADMPGLVQTSHLLFASILFGLFTWILLNLRSVTKVTP